MANIRALYDRTMSLGQSGRIGSAIQETTEGMLFGASLGWIASRRSKDIVGNVPDELTFGLIGSAVPLLMDVPGVGGDLLRKGSCHAVAIGTWRAVQDMASKKKSSGVHGFGEDPIIQAAKLL